MKILFVENHTTFAQLTTRQFLAAHDVEIVPDLARARAVLAEQSFDVLLIDYDLDDGKGDELVRAVKEQSPRPLIVGISAHQAGNDALMTAGADGICAKLQFAQIGTLLEKLIPAE